jgi:hypothetical protein
MSNVKLKFACHWDSVEGISDRVIRNWGNPPEGFETVTGEDFDYLISFNVSEEMLRTPKEKNIIFTMEPDWSSCIQDHIIEKSYKIFTSVKRFSDYENVIISPTLMFHEDSGGSTHNNIKQYGAGIQKMPEDYISNDNFSKNKKCSILLAGHGTTLHPNCRYPQREAFLAKILNSDLDVDIYGRNWNISDSRYKGYAIFKEDALLDYEFSIAIENSKEDYYISEKFTDCFMNNCVPIYDGCKLAAEFYNPESFEVIDIDSDNSIEKVRDILNNTNEKYINSVKDSKLKYFTDYNIYTYLKQCI